MQPFAQTCKWYLSFATGIFECLGFTGVIYGWASLVFVLKNEGYFLDFCVQLNNSSGNFSVGCDLQDERFTLVFTIASFAFNFLAFPCGVLFDYLGTMATRTLAVSLYTTATLMMAFSTAASATLLFPALSLMAIGGILLFITNIQIGNLFGNNRATIITIFNGALDSSAAVFLLVKGLYEVRIPLKSMFLFISFLSSNHLLRTFLLFPRTRIPYPLPEGYTYGVSCKKLELDSFSGEEDTESQKKPEHGGIGMVGVEIKAQEVVEEDTGENISEEEAEKGDRQEEVEGSDSVNPQISRPRDSEWNKDHIPSFRSCVFSKIFLTHLFWLSAMALLHNLYIGTLNPMLTLFAGADHFKVSHFTNAFAFTQLCGLFCSPLNGLILDRHRRKGKSPESVTSQRLADMKSAVLSLAITVTQCVLFAIFATIPVLDVQYLTFAMQVINRSFLFGGNATFITIAFPPCHFGKIFGLALAVSAVVSLLQYPCFALVLGPLQHNPLYLNIGFIALVSLAYVHPINVHVTCRRETRKSEGMKHSRAEVPFMWAKDD
ncbi:solute carrier family 43 member 3-like [Carcharodon carcharias]|uniref:solute carrier family 43 member 3-like n=1 Tax=Carcharodon carcharias TaxID=13397 RepID=UPI001B7F5EBB|nr:solute carrier family 43 member 3-like [Carcharodon carcharias]